MAFATKIERMYYSRAAEGGNRSTGSADASERALGAAAGSGPALVDLEAAERARLIDEIRALEDLKSAVAAAQARATAAFDASSRRSQARAGLKTDQLGRGIGSQIGLARRESPRRGTQLLGLARILTTEMPHTLNALSQGVISEYRATILVRETACLSLPDRQCVDEQIAGNLAELEQLGDAKLIARIKALSYGLDPHSVVNRAAKAVSERYVSCRPAPDTMTYLTGLLPVTQGVGVYAALSREADRLRASGDPRGRGQIMADTLVERVTGQARAEDARIEVQLIMTDRTMLHGLIPSSGFRPAKAGKSSRSAASHVAPATNAGAAAGNEMTEGRSNGDSASFVPDGAEPAVLNGYGTVPAQWARDLVRGSRPGGDKPPGTADNASDEDDPGGAAGAAGDNAGWGRKPLRPDPQTEVWLRRLYVAPDTGRLTGMDSRARLVPDGLARLIAARDQVCRMPWCGAPIRHYDHIRPFREGGLTSAENIQGLCVACNQAKEAPGWDSVVTDGVEAPESSEVPATPGTPAAPSLPSIPATGAFTAANLQHWGRHTVLTRTPTGHVYRSSAPRPPTGTINGYGHSE